MFDPVKMYAHKRNETQETPNLSSSLWLFLVSAPISSLGACHASALMYLLLVSLCYQANPQEEVSEESQPISGPALAP